MKVKRATGTAVPMAIGMISGVGLGLITTILLSGLVAYLVLTEKLQETSVGYCAAIILASSVGLGCLIATVLIKRMLMQVCIGVGGSYYGMLLVITALFFGGNYRGMGVTALVVFGTALAVGLLKLHNNERKQRARKKYRRR